MSLLDFFKNAFKKKSNTIVHVLKGNSLIVNIGHRADDSVGMTDFKRFYQVKKGKINYKIIKKHAKNEQCNFFNTYEITPKTEFAYVAVFEKSLSHLPPNPTKIWNVNLTKNRRPFRKLKIQ